MTLFRLIIAASKMVVFLIIIFAVTLVVPSLDSMPKLIAVGLRPAPVASARLEVKVI